MAEGHKMEIISLKEKHAEEMELKESEAVTKQAEIKTEADVVQSKMEAKIKNLETKMTTLVDNLVGPGGDTQSNFINVGKIILLSLFSILSMLNLGIEERSGKFEVRGGYQE